MVCWEDRRLHGWIQSEAEAPIWERFWVFFLALAVFPSCLRPHPLSSFPVQEFLSWVGEELLSRAVEEFLSRAVKELLPWAVLSHAQGSPSPFEEEGRFFPFLQALF